jgi:N-acetylglutamate synthase-like GNAT family acetyltransferase
MGSPLITAQVESLTERLDELKSFFPLHWEELALNKDRVPLQPNYDEYLRRDEHGAVLFATVRKQGALIGYFVGFIAPHLHYQTCLTLTMDIFYIDPEHRDGSPRAGIRLFREVEREARRRGVQRMFVGSKLHRDASRLFDFLGYERVEVYYSKMLDEAEPQWSGQQSEQ